MNSSSTEKSTEKTPEWGRVIICGGVDWPRLGRSNIPELKADLEDPHIIRSLATVKVVSVHSGHSASHFIAIDTDGKAHMFGRNVSGQLGNDSVSPFVDESEPFILSPHSAGASKTSKWVDAACSRHHTILLSDDGDVFSSGMNNFGQCGHDPTAKPLTQFKKINGPWCKAKEAVKRLAVGLNFSLFCTESGKVYAVGSGQKGVLGQGRTGETLSGRETSFDIISSPTLVKGFADKVIVDIAAGQMHAMALDSEGHVFAWGDGGYGRLGIGSTKDVMIPVLVPEFSKPNVIYRALSISAGPTSSLVIGKTQMLYMAGKWKLTGDASSGSPWSYFKLVPELSGCKSNLAVAGGSGNYVIAQGEVAGRSLNVAWGQGTKNGELASGEGNPRSVTKPDAIASLDGISLISLAAGQNSACFLARPSNAVSDLPRHPELLEEPEEKCLVCHLDDSEKTILLECEKCQQPYHGECLVPALEAVPEGEWFCQNCLDDSSAAIKSAKTKTKAQPKAEAGKRKAAGSSETPKSKKKR